MKKWLLVLGIITCMLGLTACKTEEEVKDHYGITEEAAGTFAQNFIESMDKVVLNNEVEQYKDDEIIHAALNNYMTALEDMGSLQSVNDYTVTYDDGVIINAKISGSLREATVELILDKQGSLLSVSTNVTYSFGEMMAKAGLNTLMGLGTVFVVLILIILLISSFSLISKIQNSTANKAEEETVAADRVVEQIMEREEKEDDLELVAVIAAAVAAYEGTASADGYIVRSIKRRNR
ncbi:MAG: OadG family transporter subunit [Lachnospiraceae bacterium]